MQAASWVEHGENREHILVANCDDLTDKRLICAARHRRR